MKILKRILASPFMLAILLIYGIAFILKKWITYLRYGGEILSTKRKTF